MTENKKNNRTIEEKVTPVSAEIDSLLKSGVGSQKSNESISSPDSSKQGKPQDSDESSELTLESKVVDVEFAETNKTNKSTEANQDSGLTEANQSTKVDQNGEYASVSQGSGMTKVGELTEVSGDSGLVNEDYLKESMIISNGESVESESDGKLELAADSLAKEIDKGEHLNGSSVEQDEDKADFSRLDGLSDDEAIIELDKMMKQNDELIEKDYLGALLNQNDNLVYYEVENIYHNENKKAYRNRMRMRRDPPVLVIRDEEGNEANFQLTENLTDELTETLKEVKRAYYGFSGPRDINKPEKFLDRMKYYARENAFKILATIFIVLFIVSLNL